MSDHVSKRLFCVMSQTYSRIGPERSTILWSALHIVRHSHQFPPSEQPMPFEIFLQGSLFSTLADTG